ncbi:MAG TPA: hypothetical protein VF510_04315 [Ktedonobacterales bacterium]
MDLELAGLIAATASFFITIPLAARARARRAPHALLICAAFSVGYSLLAIVFVADALMRQPLSETLRFTRGIGAGIAVGLLLSGCVLYAYDEAYRARAPQRGHSKE